ncbi:MAG: alpha/beta fold hydrolase [Clostridiaceae bacterium]
MDTSKKKIKIWLCIAIALMLVSMVFASCIQTSWGKVTVKDLRWETTVGIEMSGLLFVPDGVSAENKAPAIVVSHGMFNNREMQDANFVELARRGFVVLSMDMFSHGYSDNVSNIGLVTTGMYEAVKMLTTLSYVDTTRIGITGHSLGGMSSNTAVAQDNAASVQLISAVLLNCADATYTDATTNEYTNIYGSRDVGIVAAQYDEFFMSQTDADGNTTAPRDYLKNSNAQSFLYFGTDPSGMELRTASTVYTETVDGTEAMRVIYNPAIIHPWSHFSKQSTAATIEFFDEALGAPNPISSTDQVWQWKEFFNFLGLIGFAMFVVNFAILMASTPFFSSIKKKELAAPRAFAKGGKLWFWGSLAAAALFGTLTYLPIMNNVGSFTFMKSPWAQSSPWGVGCWAAITGLFAILSMVLSYHLHLKKNGANAESIGVKIGAKNLGKTVLLALIVVIVSYGCVFFADYFFKTDFRIWVLGIKAFDAKVIYTAVFPYLLLFVTYYTAASVAANSFNNNTLGLKEGKRAWINTAVLAAFSAIPPLVLLAIQYTTFFSTGFLAWSGSNMQVVWLFPVLVFLPVTTIMSRKVFKETGNPYLPGIINGVLVTLIACSNTLTWS